MQAAEQAQTTAMVQGAMVVLSKAELQQAEIQLEHTKIYSPINGKSGDIMVNEGDYVMTGGLSSPMVVVNQLEKVLVNFYVTQEKLNTILSCQKKGILKAKIATEDNKKILGVGELVFIDNKVNSQTGMLLLKVAVANQDYIVWPGMIVTVRLIVDTEADAVVVPVKAVQLDQYGYFVYCVENNKVKINRVKIARQLERLVVIKTGLKGGEKVITVLPPNLAEGVIVEESMD